ncbi:MAG: type II toxin-antitoxin system RelE/ParE family toxin [Proteobacteria bacterium]|nr:type II toxin-antitoxin system RelE/ParE family toxin [Pseudomonadota bacterium]
MHSVIETRSFLRDAQNVGMSESEREAIVAAISRDPKRGDLMQGTGGARKIRFAGRGKGKSGGYRVVTFYAADAIPVFLLAVISKGERANLSRAEQNALRVELAGLVDDYRAGAARRIAAFTRLRR